MLRRYWMMAAFTAILAGAALATQGAPQASYKLNIGAQPMDDALNEFARQSGLQVILQTEEVRGISAPRIEGTFTARDALVRLLENSGLEFEYLNDRTVAVRVKGMTEDRASVSSVYGAGADGAVRLAQADTPSAASSTDQATSAAAGDADGGKLEEIIVTAQKREERLIDTPQSVTVLSADALAKLGATQFRDFANTVPGLSFQTTGAGATQITLRGVTTGFDVGPTVAVYVDEVPYGSSSAFARGAQIALDVGLFDIDRIEVLRGPQGTLYGASTMGGLIKYVGKRPNANRFALEAQTGLADVQNGSMSYNAAAAVNVPLVTDTVALRASGFYARDGGFIDNLADDKEDVDRSNIYGGRVDLLFTPTEAFSIRVGGFLQDITRDGQSTIEYTAAGNPQYGSLNQYRRVAEPSEQRFRLASGTLTYDFGPATLTSISSYQTAQSENYFDLSAVYVPLLAAALQRSYSAVGDPPYTNTDKFTQELRLGSAADQSVEWVIGGFYTDEDSRYSERFDLFDFSDQLAANDLYTYLGLSKYREYAAFGDLTWHLTDQLNLTGGLRYAHNSQSYTQIGSGLFIGSRPTTRSSEGVMTYLANARYQFNDHATSYLRYATGYRPGGPNLSANDPVTGLPLGKPTFEADRLKSYEVGFKAETEDRRFGMDLAGYYIDWSDIQILAIRGGFALRANALAGATVRGTELTLTARPSRDFALSAAFAFQDAQLSGADADLGAAKGERLPNVPRFTAAVNTDYKLPGSLHPTIGATLRYVGDRMTSFDNSTLPQYRLPDYTSVDLRTALEFERVNVQLYVRNVFDERGQISSMLPQFGTRVAILQPRTIGFNLTTQF